MTVLDKPLIVDAFKPERKQHLSYVSYVSYVRKSFTDSEMKGKIAVKKAPSLLAGNNGASSQHNLHCMCVKGVSPRQPAS
jgi:hypothetical protein